jgi:ribosomal protein S18 acetylase RimI-like enzyme
MRFFESTPGASNHLTEVLDDIADALYSQFHLAASLQRQSEGARGAPQRWRHTGRRPWLGRRAKSLRPVATTYRRLSLLPHRSPRSRSRGLFHFTGGLLLHRLLHNRVMHIDVVESVSSELVEAIASLLSQLSSSSPPSADELAAIVASPATSLLVARDAASILGTLTLAVFRIPTGVRARIEDVVVDESARGRGIGEALTLRAVDLAREAGARSVDLTSRPAREAANRLYRRLGFEERESNVLRFTLR